MFELHFISSVDVENPRYNLDSWWSVGWLKMHDVFNSFCIFGKVYVYRYICTILYDAYVGLCRMLVGVTVIYFMVLFFQWKSSNNFIEWWMPLPPIPLQSSQYTIVVSCNCTVLTTYNLSHLSLHLSRIWWF